VVLKTQSKDVDELLSSIRAPHLFGQVGFGIVLGAFVLAFINALLPEPIAFLSKILQPLIFVWLASLLYHIGQHLHVLHKNVIRMASMEESQAGDMHGQ